MNRIFFMDFCNYEDYPIGGHLSFAKQLLSSFGNQLILLGITTDKSDPVGKWFKKRINGTEYDFFALARYNKYKTYHFIPDRISCFFLIRFFKNRILKMHVHNVFVQRPEIIIAIKDFKFTNICYRFPGTENALKTSKYRAGKYLASCFDKLFFPALKDVDLILASADENAILSMVNRSKGLILRDNIVKFPTRIDTGIYRPIERDIARGKIGIPFGKKVLITVGRLSWLKGWKLMLDSFLIFEKKHPGSIFYFIGNGEDINKIKDYIDVHNLNGKVFILGMKSPEEISLLLNASDLFMMGSYVEGWSTSLVEAVACGIPVCVTSFSSASEIVKDGINGFIAKSWDSKEFAHLCSEALNLEIKEIDVNKYSLAGLKAELLKYWIIE